MTSYSEIPKARTITIYSQECFIMDGKTSLSINDVACKRAHSCTIRHSGKTVLYI